MPRMRALILILLVGLTSHASATDTAIKQTPEDIIPVTMANLQGHKTLYKEGWFIISSSEKALTYAKEHSIDSSARALNKLKTNSSQRTQTFKKNTKADLANAVDTSKQIYQAGTEQSKRILAGSHQLAQAQWAFAKKNSGDALNTVISGYIHLSQRTHESRSALMNVPNGYVKGVKEDFSELKLSLDKINESNSLEIKKNWSTALDQAHDEFQMAYDKSGHSHNSLTALWRLTGGYLGALWQGLFKPTAKTAWQVTQFTATVAGQAIFLPVASGYILTKNTLRSTGLALYYTAKTGIEVISPTVKGGYLASLSLLSAGAVPLTYVAGTSVGFINQVGTTVAAPAAGTGQGLLSTTANTLSYGALLTYDSLTATTKVFVNQVKSGVVLGYNALTAIPSQLLLGTVNSAYFLVIDGPRLTLAAVKGQVNFKDGQQLDTGHLPVGSVVNLKTLQQNSDAEIQVISQDPVVINQVLNELVTEL